MLPISIEDSIRDVTRNKSCKEKETTDIHIWKEDCITLYVVNSKYST